MRRLSRLGVTAALAAVVLCAAACGSDALRVTSIQLGRSLNADATVAKPTTVFGPSDTIYVSVLTAGSDSGTIGVKWTYAGRVIGEPKKTVVGRDVAAVEFNLRSAAGFPPGEYKVEAFLDGQPVGTREFRVEPNR